MENEAVELLEEEAVRPQAVTVKVNDHPVVLSRHRVTGLEIKQAAIAQGVNIQLDFVLTLETPRGGKVIGDSDVVTVNQHSEFLAVAPDDNS